MYLYLKYQFHIHIFISNIYLIYPFFNIYNLFKYKLLGPVFKKMKNLVWLICVFSAMFSCKQTKLTQNFKRVSKNIYVQPTIKKHFKEVALDKMKSNYYSKNKAINKMDINPLNCSQIVNKEEFYAVATLQDPVVILNTNKFYQNLISTDSIIKSQNNPTKEEDEEILKLSRKAKNFNLIGILIGLVSLISFENLGGL